MEQIAASVMHDRRALGLHPVPKEKHMKCDICGEDVKNSEELQRHMEGQHPTDDDDNENGESPDLLGDTPDESAEVETPKPTY
jgi:hypothetical protein